MFPRQTKRTETGLGDVDESAMVVDCGMCMGW